MTVLKLINIWSWFKIKQPPLKKDQFENLVCKMAVISVLARFANFKMMTVYGPIVQI